jgi:hypothetical protein
MSQGGSFKPSRPHELFKYFNRSREFSHRLGMMGLDVVFCRLAPLVLCSAPLLARLGTATDIMTLKKNILSTSRAAEGFVTTFQSWRDDSLDTIYRKLSGHRVQIGRSGSSVRIKPESSQQPSRCFGAISTCAAEKEI